MYEFVQKARHVIKILYQYIFGRGVKIALNSVHVVCTRPLSED